MTTSVDTREVAEGEMGPTESFGFFLKMMNFVTGINTHIMFYVDRDAPTGRENVMRGCKQGDTHWDCVLRKREGLGSRALVILLGHFSRSRTRHPQ